MRATVSIGIMLGSAVVTALSRTESFHESALAPRDRSRQRSARQLPPVRQGKESRDE